jgi:hypothetical protein
MSGVVRAGIALLVLAILTVLAASLLNSGLVTIGGLVVGVFGFLLVIFGLLSHGPTHTDALVGVVGELNDDDLDVFDLQGTMAVDLDTDEVLAHGRRADALLVHLLMTNKTAGQVDPLTLPTPRCHHPVAFLTIEVQPPGETFFRLTKAFAVPPAKLHALDVGARLPVAFDNDQQEAVVAIDWTGVPG